MTSKIGSTPRITLVLVLAFALAATVAAAGERRTVDITDRATLNGATLEPGTYSVRWDDGDGDGVVRVEFRLRNKLVAEAKARVETREQPAAYTSLIIRTMDDGSRTPAEIRTRGKREVLVIES